MAISISLSRQERDLLFRHVAGLDELMQARLRQMVANRQNVIFQFSDTTIQFLRNAIQEAIKEAPRSVRPALAELARRFERVKPQPAPEVETPKSLRSYRQEYHNEIAEAFRTRQPADLEEANAMLREMSAARNRRPLAEFNGLSPLEMVNLLHADWKKEDSSIVLREDIPPEDLEEIDLLFDARLFLRLLHEQGGTKATTAGNLNRKFVRAMVDQMRAAAGIRLVLEQAEEQRVLNEGDILSLQIIRCVLTAEGLIRTYKGSFVLTKAGERMLPETQAGALFAAIFRGFFRRLNMACLDWYGDYGSIQYCFPYTLVMLDRFAGDWVPLKDLLPKLFHPLTIEEVNSNAATYQPGLKRLARTRILEPLERFGLIEIKREELDTDYGLPSISAVRKTPRFNRFLEFRLDSGPASRERG